MSESTDVIVAGAGAAGLLAAIRCAERGRRTVLLEKNPRPGVKILMSGGTRCNVTHNCDAKGIVAAYGTQGRFLHSALAALGPRELVSLIEAEGVPTKVESTGKIFPVSDKAGDILEALLRRVHRSGARIETGVAVTSIDNTGDRWRVGTTAKTFEAPSLIIATGGCSYPGSGTTGDGYKWLTALGHTIVPLRPALVPITTDAAWVKDLMGVTLPDVLISIHERLAPEQNSARVRPLASRRGSLLFAHFGLSGPTALDVSRVVAGHPQPRGLDVHCDFLPDTKVDVFDAQIRDFCGKQGKKSVGALIPDVLPRRLVSSLLAHLQIPEDRRCAEIGKESRSQLIAALKDRVIPVSGTLGFKKAEVTAGGVSLAEVDSRTMQSKIARGLYLAGEILDLDGPIGGFNFQAAFSTGWLAGTHA